MQIFIKCKYKERNTTIYSEKSTHYSPFDGEHYLAILGDMVYSIDHCIVLRNCENTGTEVICMFLLVLTDEGIFKSQLQNNITGDKIN